MAGGLHGRGIRGPTDSAVGSRRETRSPGAGGPAERSRPGRGLLLGLRGPGGPGDAVTRGTAEHADRHPGTDDLPADIRGAIPRAVPEAITWPITGPTARGADRRHRTPGTVGRHLPPRRDRPGRGARHDPGR